MKINKSWIYIISILYLILPISIFLLTWLNIWLGSVSFIVLILSYYLVINKIKCEIKGYFIFSKDIWICTFIILVFLFSTGHGGFFATSGLDIPWRDAIYQDLIHYSWPVIYDKTHTALVYYMTYWLVPAGVSFLLGLGKFGSNVIMFIWTYIGINLIFYLLCDYLHVSKRQIYFVCFLFLFWSGLNTLGMLPKSIFAHTAFRIDDYPAHNSWVFTGGHDHGYMMYYLIRTSYDSIANIYNQFIAVVLVTILFLRLNKQISLFTFLCILVLPYSPFGFLGLFLLMFGFGVYKVFNAIKKENICMGIHKCIFFPNLVAIFIISPIFYFYFIVNTMSGGNSIFYVQFNQYGVLRVVTLILYYLLYFGIYLYLLDNKYKKSLIYWLTFFVLILIPIFRLGVDGDLNWNASIAPFFIVMVMVMEQVLSAWNAHKFWGRDLCLVILLGIAVLTPLMQITTSLRSCYLERKIAVYIDKPNLKGTLANKDPNELRNFLSPDYENSIFYRYIAKK